MNVVFVTGNANKARYFSELIGLPIKHMPADVEEIQSLDLKEVAEHKARSAYKQLKRPVIVEDVAMQVNFLGKLPGPFIKWFIEEIGLEKICRLADASEDRGAIASCVYAYYDGKLLKLLEGSLSGTIAKHPRGAEGFGWNPTFVPEGSEQTLAEMDEPTFKKFYIRIKPIPQLKEFLTGLDKI
ncbi:MAG TPA: non-canonical purine NTP pyrophosphatase [Candidatus Binatia bacterium]|nr:non-canonical purine NTP pyrophosphatase [Candidatus Binatia bacterium]